MAERKEPAHATALLESFLEDNLQSPSFGALPADKAWALPVGLQALGEEFGEPDSQVWAPFSP